MPSQYALGAYAYLWPRLGLPQRLALGPLHRLGGAAAWLAGLGAVASGLQEKATFLQAFEGVKGGSAGMRGWDEGGAASLWACSLGPVDPAWLRCKSRSTQSPWRFVRLASGRKRWGLDRDQLAMPTFAHRRCNEHTSPGVGSAVLQHRLRVMAGTPAVSCLLGLFERCPTSRSARVQCAGLHDLRPHGPNPRKLS